MSDALPVDAVSLRDEVRAKYRDVALKWNRSTTKIRLRPD